MCAEVFVKRKRIQSFAFFTLFMALSFLIRSPVMGAPQTKLPPLSAEAIQLLENLKAETARYADSFKSGTVEFTITRRTRIGSPSPTNGADDYEEQGTWDITYRFGGGTHFYDVKARKKRELSSGTPLDAWTEIHHRYSVEGDTLVFSEKVGPEWKRHPPQKMPADIFQNEFNPHWWGWPPHRFPLNKLFFYFEPIEVKALDAGDGLYLRLYRPADQRLDSNRTFEIWIDTRKTYHATRLIRYERGIRETFWLTDGGDRLFNTKPYLQRSQTTYQFAEYEHGVWFPKTVTHEITEDYELANLFPNISVSEVPALMSESLLQTKRMLPYHIDTMQVRSATFNTDRKE